MFSWDHPFALLALWLVLPAAWILLLDRHSLRSRQARFADLPLFRRMNIRLPKTSELAGIALKLAALFLLILALAGPRVGGRLGARVPGERPAVVLLLDVSKSMGATDTAPSRMEVAHAKLETVIGLLEGWRASMVAFADDAVVFCPMTTDRGATQALLQRMKPGMKELKQGSNLENAIRMALAQLQGRPGSILLATDGESLSGDPAKAAAEASKAGVPLYIVGVGTREGAMVPDGADLFGAPVMKRGRDGVPVLSHADPEGLNDLAKKTGGSLVDGATTGAGELLARELKQRYGSDGVLEQGESLFQWPLALALILLLLEDLMTHRRSAQFGIHLSLARFASGFKRMSGLILVPLALSQMAWTWPWAQGLEIQRAAGAYEKGDWKGALAILEKAHAMDPDNPHLRYDLGNAQYQAGKYEGAVHAFSKALEALPNGSKTQLWAHYNLGNALYRLGEAKGDRKSNWTEAIEHYEAVLKLDPKEEDARFNLELVKKRLKELQPEQDTGKKASNNGEPTPDPNGAALPNDAEVQATLDALQHQEKQHQAELEASPAPAPPPTTGELLKQLMNQGMNQSDRPDW